MHPALLLVHPTNFKKPKTAPACLQKLFYIFKNNGTVECLRSASLLPHSLSRFLSSVHSASSLFFVSLHLIRFGEGSRFSLFGAIFSSIPWQWLGAVKVKVPMFSVVVVVGGIRSMHLCWVCILVYRRSCRSS